jgi:hypothetical protein
MKICNVLCDTRCSMKPAVLLIGWPQNESCIRTNSHCLSAFKVLTAVSLRIEGAWRRTRYVVVKELPAFLRIASSWCLALSRSTSTVNAEGKGSTVHPRRFQSSAAAIQAMLVLNCVLEVACPESHTLTTKFCSPSSCKFGRNTGMDSRSGRDHGHGCDL